MADNLPDSQGTVDGPATYDDQVAGIADLLDDSDLDPNPGEQKEAETADDDVDPVSVDDPAEDVEQVDDENADGSEEPDIKGGRFAPHTAKVTLDDGTVTTVAELVRNNLYQRDYTKKTTALKGEEEALARRKSEVDQQAQSSNELAQFAMWYSENYLPQAKPPEPFEGDAQTDPHGFMVYQQKLLQFQQMQGLQQYFAEETKKRETAKVSETQKQAETALASELQALRTADPKFWGDPKRSKAFVEEVLSKGSEWWGVTQDDLAQLRTAKQWNVLRDAMRWRRAQAKAPEVQKQVQAKPGFVSGGRRSDPRMGQRKEQSHRSEQLRKTGRMSDGVASLMDLKDL